MDIESYSKSRMSPFDEAALTCLLDQFHSNALKILEVGSFFGAGSTQILAKYAQQIVCVDHWEGNDNAEHKEIVKIVDPYTIFHANTEAIRDKVVAIRANSSCIGDLLSDEYFDFIFIDGDHRYSQTKQDINNCLPKLKKTGIIAGHDCEGRLSEENSSIIQEHINQDHCSSIFYNFKEMHPGVIFALSELLPSSCLFAEKEKLEIVVDNEVRRGHSSIWYKECK